ncbi:MAG: NAD-dependent epimerase/dehydratase family protein [candidate division NC10 bacterium]|nr:NAD-dependent epimerase/dehydratase family protein [candidate division NC10 bacterium]
MKVLITGGAGFLGSHLTDALLARGDEVTILDVVSDLKVRHNLGNPHFHYVRDSVLHADILESLILKCDLIYHLAAVVGVEHYVGDPYEVLNVNINGAQAVLKLAYKYNRKVVFSSTSEVYGRNPKVPFAEDDERVLGSTRIDRWCYSTSKAAAEHFCFAYHRLGLPMVVLRYFNVYGPRLDKIDVGRVITIFMGQVLRGEPVTVIGDGKQTRCFTYIDDAIRATVEAGTNERAVGEIFNVGTDVETSVLELAETMIRIAGSRSKVVFVPQESVYGDSYEDVPRRVPRVQRMHEILKVRAETPLEKGLRQTIEWFKAGNGR